MSRSPLFHGPEAFFLLFGGIWLLVGVPFFAVGAYMGISRIVLEQRLAKEGRIDSAAVIEKFTRTNEGSTSYWVRYRFYTPTDQMVEDTAQIERRVWERLAPQQTIPVEYAASDPRFHRVEGQVTDWVFPAAFGGMGAVFGTAGAIIFGKGVRRYRRRQRLEREGVAAEGIVSRVVERNISLNRVRQWTLYYTYSDYRGQTHEGDSGLIPPGEAALWQPGDKGEIRFDPARPEDSIWMGKNVANSQE